MGTPPVWAIIGRKGSGKDTAGDYLRSLLGGELFSASACLRRHKDDADQRPLWEVEQELARSLGPAFMVDEALQLPGRPVFMTGLRSRAPLVRVRELGGVVLFIDVPWQVRHERVRTRQRPGEVIADAWQPDSAYVPPRVLQGGASWEELASLAHHRISNGGAPEELRRSLDELVARLG